MACPDECLIELDPSIQMYVLLATPIIPMSLCLIDTLCPSESEVTVS